MAHSQEGATVGNVEPGGSRGRFARWWFAGDWGVRLLVAWTVLVAGALIVLEVSLAASPDDGYVSNGDLGVFAFFIAAALWTIGVILGVILIRLSAFLVYLSKQGIAWARAPQREP